MQKKRRRKTKKDKIENVEHGAHDLWGIGSTVTEISTKMIDDILNSVYMRVHVLTPHKRVQRRRRKKTKNKNVSDFLPLNVERSNKNEMKKL